jgi:hypothetical protein
MNSLKRRRKMMQNKLIDETLTEVTPYKLAVIEMYKKYKSDKNSITYEITPEYLNKLKEQLNSFKAVIQDNIDKASAEKEKLEKKLDEMDAEYMERVASDTTDSPEEVEKLLTDAFEQGYEESHRSYLIDQFITTKKSEMATIDDMIKEIDAQSDVLKNAIVNSKMVVNLIHDITKDEEMVTKWKDDFAKIQEKSKEENVDNWVTILKYCSMTKAKKEILDLQKKMNETVQNLLTFYKEYVKDEDAKVIETIPEINWYGKDRSSRYNEFDGVIQYMRDKLYKTYLENQANLDNTKLKEIKSLVFNVDQLCLSKELRDTRLIEAFTIPNPVERYSYRVNMLAKPIMEELYSDLIENAYEFALYTMSIIREPNAFWIVFLLAGEM